MTTSCPIPLIPCTNPDRLLLFTAVSCGWPSPALDYAEPPLSIDELVSIRACSTFLVRAQGHSMIGAGIYEADVLVVDRSLTAVTGDVVVAVVDGDFTMKRLGTVDGQVALLPENPEMQPIVFAEGQELFIWGVVTWNLHRLRG